MTIAASLRKLFKRHLADYQVLYHKRTTSLHLISSYLDIPTSKIVKALVLQDKNQYILAVLPMEAKIDFMKLKSKLNRKFFSVAQIKSDRIFFDCEPGNYPPFGEPYGLDVIIDSSILKMDQLYFCAGSNSSIIEMSLNDFFYINSTCQKFSFIKKVDIEDLSFSCSEPENLEIISGNLMDLDLPDIPPLAKKLLADFLAKGTNSLEEMTNLIANDDLIHHYIENYSNSLFFKNKLNLLENKNTDDNLANFLKFDAVSHIALGAAVSQAFSKAKDKEELKNYWFHALCSATLAYELVYESKKYKVTGLNSSKAYSAGLFHNIGLLILERLCYHEFKLLLKWRRIQPKLPIEILEKKLLGMGRSMQILRYGHAELGASLLQYWGLPEFIAYTAKYHHKNKYAGKYNEYVNLIQLTNQILAYKKIGDESLGPISQNHLDFLGLEKEKAFEILENILADKTNIDSIATMLTNHK